MHLEQPFKIVSVNVLSLAIRLLAPQVKHLRAFVSSRTRFVILQSSQRCPALHCARELFPIAFTASLHTGHFSLGFRVYSALDCKLKRVAYSNSCSRSRKEKLFCNLVYTCEAVCMSCSSRSASAKSDSISSSVTSCSLRLLNSSSDKRKARSRVCER